MISIALYRLLGAILILAALLIGGKRVVIALRRRFRKEDCSVPNGNTNQDND